MRLPVLMMLLLPSLGRAAGCNLCHSREAAEWSESAHARSLGPVLQSRFYQALPEGPIGEARGGFLMKFGGEGKELEVTSWRGAETATALISWV
ncbi:MAG: hypothetical protein ABUS51_03720, partial [Acidobacteriota bacterium]